MDNDTGMNSRVEIELRSLTLRTMALTVAHHLQGGSWRYKISLTLTQADATALMLDRKFRSIRLFLIIREKLSKVTGENYAGETPRTN